MIKDKDIGAYELYIMIMYGYSVLNDQGWPGNAAEARKLMAHCDLFIDDDPYETCCEHTEAYQCTNYLKKVLAYQVEHNISALHPIQFDGRLYFAPMPFLRLTFDDYKLLEKKRAEFVARYGHLVWHDSQGVVPCDDIARSFDSCLYVEPVFEGDQLRVRMTSVLDITAKTEVYAFRP